MSIGINIVSIGLSVEVETIYEECLTTVSGLII